MSVVTGHGVTTHDSTSRPPATTSSEVLPIVVRGRMVCRVPKSMYTCNSIYILFQASRDRMSGFKVTSGTGAERIQKEKSTCIKAKPEPRRLVLDASSIDPLRPYLANQTASYRTTCARRSTGTADHLISSDHSL
jgi:hypothetical protein